MACQALANWRTLGIIKLMDRNSLGWTDEEWEQSSNYADELDVIIKIPRDLPYGPVSRAFVLSVPQPDITRDWAERQVANLALIGPEGSKPVPEPFILDARHRQVSWGASGGSYEIILWLANSGVEVGLGVALQALGNKIANLRKERFESQPQPLLDREQVDASAKRCVWWTRDRLDPSAEAMHVESTTAHQDGRWTTTIAAPDGVRYSVSTHQILDGIVLSSVEDTTWGEAPQE